MNERPSYIASWSCGGGSDAVAHTCEVCDEMVWYDDEPEKHAGDCPLPELQRLRARAAEVFIVFRSEWEESDVVGVAEDEELARALAARTREGAGGEWTPSTWAGMVACWKNRRTYVYIERHTVERRIAGAP